MKKKTGAAAKGAMLPFSLLMCAVQGTMVSTTCFLGAPVAPCVVAPVRQLRSSGRVLLGGMNSPGQFLLSWRQRCSTMCAQDEGEQTRLQESSRIHTSTEATLRSGRLGERVPKRRRYRQDLTPKLCMNLRAGGCYDRTCRAYHGSRYFDEELGLWRLRRMFRQSTARPVHELASSRGNSIKTVGVAATAHSDVVQNDTFVLKASTDWQTADVDLAVAPMALMAPQSSEGFIKGERVDKSATSRAVKNYGSWRSMCDRCQRPDKVCICSSLPKKPIPIETRLIILQHPKERKKATYGTVPIVRLCIDNVHVITANLNGPIDLDLPPSSEVDAGKRHMEKKHQHEMKRSAALCAAFAQDSVLQQALERDNTLLLFPDLDPNDPFLLERPELLQNTAVNLEQHFAQGRSPPVERGAAGAGDADAEWRGCTLIAIDGTWAQVGCSCGFGPGALARKARVEAAG